MIFEKYKKNKRVFLKKQVRHIALLLLVALFATTFLLPVSKAHAAPIKLPTDALKNATKIPSYPSIPMKTGGSVTKKAGGAAAGAAAGSFSGAIGVAVILGLVVGGVALADKFVSYMLNPDPVLYNLNNSFINIGWRMIRDLCNLFFLLVLLFIAFCTILQIEKYNAKKNLLTLILMALLINFSKPIAIFIFDGSQLLMQWLLVDANRNGQLPTTLFTFSKIAEVLKDNVWNAGLSWDLPVTFLFSIIFIFIFFVVYFCLGLFLLIRIVAIWLLVIVSPVAFFAMILPDFRKLANQWWDALFRYCYVGPAIAFFLWLADKLRTLQGQIVGKNMVIADASSSLQNMPVFIPYMITIVFLFAALMMANQFGIQFSQAITKSAEKFMAGTALYGAKWLERRKHVMSPSKTWIGQKLGLSERFTLSPRALIGGWQQRSKEIDEKALRVAAGGARDSLHKYLDKTETHYQQLEVDRIKNEEAKRLKEHAEDFNVLGGELAKAVGSKMDNAAEKICAVLRIAYGNRDQDEIVHFIRNNWDKNILGNGKSFADVLGAQGIKLKDVVVDGHAVSNIAEALLKGTQNTNQSYINKELSDLGQIAAGNGGVGFGAVTRGEDGKLRRTSREEQGWLQTRKHLTVFEPQDKAKRTHRNWETNEVTKEVGRAMIENMRWTSAAEIANASRTNISRLERVGTDVALNDNIYKTLEEMRNGTLKVYDPAHDPNRTGATVEIKVVQDNYAQQANINAAHRAAMQQEAGVDNKTILTQLAKYNFNMDEINAILKVAKRSEIK